MDRRFWPNWTAVSGAISTFTQRRDLGFHRSFAIDWHQYASSAQVELLAQFVAVVRRPEANPRCRLLNILYAWPFGCGCRPFVDVVRIGVWARGPLIAELGFLRGVLVARSSRVRRAGGRCCPRRRADARCAGRRGSYRRSSHRSRVARCRWIRGGGRECGCR